MVLLSVPSFAKNKAPVWIAIENHAFSFRLPPEFKEVPVQGIDSFVRNYAGPGIDLSFDFGSYSNDFNGWDPTTKYELVKINGRKAKIGTGEKGYYRDGESRLQAQVHFAGVYPGKTDPKLSMYASCATPEDIVTAKAIFKTIRFKKEK